MFILCTFIDQQRWHSAFEPLLYTSGLSFYRPFSYRQHYFEPEDFWRSLVHGSSAKNGPIPEEGFFGVRFQHKDAPEFHKLFVPLRKVTIVTAEQADGINLFFRLGEFVTPTEVDGRPSMPTLDLTSLVKDVETTKLCIKLDESSTRAALAWKTTADFPGGTFWEALESGLSQPATQLVRDTVLMRLIRISGRGGQAFLPPEEIDSGRHMWGFRVRQRNVYDLSVGYFRILPSSSDTTEELRYSLTNPPEELKASQRVIQLIGNYRTEDLWFSPLVPLEAPINLAIEPIVGTRPATAQTKMIGLKIPILVEEMSWPALRKANLFIGALAVLIAAVTLHAYVGASENTQKYLLIVIAAMVSVGANAFKDVITYSQH